MKSCEEINANLGSYWELPDNDLRRRRIDEHLKTCWRCESEFKLWEQSHFLIQQSKERSTLAAVEKKESVSPHVMSRIYKEESWKRPVSSGFFPISYQLQRRLSVLTAFCMALFVFSFFHSIFSDDPAYEAQTYDQLSGLMPVASAVGGTGDVAGTAGSDGLQGIPVASISDPMLFRMEPLPSDPNYFFVISILGMAATVLIMNWLSRVRS